RIVELQALISLPDCLARLLVHSTRRRAAILVSAGNTVVEGRGPQCAGLIKELEPQQMIALLLALATERNLLMETSIACDRDFATLGIPTVGEDFNQSVPSGLRASDTSLYRNKVLVSCDHRVIDGTRQPNAGPGRRGVFCRNLGINRDSLT